MALELECSVIVFACQKFDQYIYSKPVRVETDHKPLEVVAKKSTPAPRRLLLQLQRDTIWKLCTCQVSNR